MLQDSSLDFKLVQRICLLQHALDQAMDSLDELKHRVENYQLLEAQLAQTEEYANVQQKIIAHLKRQVDERNIWQRQTLQQLFQSVQGVIEQQQLELEKLRVRIQQSQTEVQDYLLRIKHYTQKIPAHPVCEDGLELTSEVMVVRSLTVSLGRQLQIAQEHIRELDTTLTQYQVVFAQLQADNQVDPGAFAIADMQEILDQANWMENPIALLQIIKTQQQKLTELNAELSEQFRHQTRLKYRCQELAAERDYYQQQLTTLQQENEVLQEQILRQASQANEYEAEIHYWKQRSHPQRTFLSCDQQGA